MINLALVLAVSQKMVKGIRNNPKIYGFLKARVNEASLQLILTAFGETHLPLVVDYDEKAISDQAVSEKTLFAELFRRNRLELLCACILLDLSILIKKKKNEEVEEEQIRSAEMDLIKILLS